MVITVLVRKGLAIFLPTNYDFVLGPYPNCIATEAHIWKVVPLPERGHLGLRLHETLAQIKVFEILCQQAIEGILLRVLNALRLLIIQERFVQLIRIRRVRDFLANGIADDCILEIINKLLEEAGWQFFDTPERRANILLENNVKLTVNTLNNYGEDFEKTGNGFIDFLLLDAQGYPFIILEAKSEDTNPLFGKEQARKYAVSQNCRFVILSNGNIHYFWDLERGNPHIISRFPAPETVKGYSTFKPERQNLVDEHVADDYIVITQKPDYKYDPSYADENNRKAYIETNKLRFLRRYQISAVQAIQSAVKNGRDRFLFEMATGTGKTLVSAAVIKLFLRTGNARRILFLVDRLELEDQAYKAFVLYLKNDYKTVIYKESRDDWRKAEIVVSTVQTFLAKNRYKRLSISFILTL